MHSYDNGTSMKAKRDNWEQLKKFFKKMGFVQISPQLVDDVIVCKPDAAVQLITIIYSILTQKQFALLFSSLPLSQLTRRGVSVDF